MRDPSSDALHCGSQQVWGKTKSKLYGPNAGVDYEDNQLRFSLLCQVTNLVMSQYDCSCSCCAIHWHQINIETVNGTL